MESNNFNANTSARARLQFAYIRDKEEITQRAFFFPPASECALCNNLLLLIVRERDSHNYGDPNNVH